MVNYAAPTTRERNHHFLWRFYQELPGLGEIDWGRFFSILGDSGYSGPVCIEVEDRAYEHSRERRMAALKQSGAYLRQFLR